MFVFFSDRESPDGDARSIHRDAWNGSTSTKCVLTAWNKSVIGTV